MQVRKANRVVLATAAAVVTAGISSAAFGQYQSNNRLYFYNSSGQVVTMSHNQSSGAPSEQYRWQVPSASSGSNTPGGITWDHSRTGAFYMGRGNTVKVMFDTGSASALLADSWNLSTAGGGSNAFPTNGNIFDMAYYNDRLYVTSDDSKIRVYNAYSGAFIHALEPYGSSRWRGIMFNAADGGNGSSDNWTVTDYANGRWTTFNSAGSTESSSPQWNIGQFGSGASSISQRIDNGNYYWVGGGENSSTFTMFNSDSNRPSGNWTSWGQATSRDIANVSNGYWFTANFGGTMWLYNNSWSPGNNWGDSQAGQGSFGTNAGLEYKRSSNPSESPIRFLGFTGLNDILINNDTEAGLPGSGTDLRSEAAASVYNPSSIISRMGSGATTVRTGDSESNGGTGSVTLAVDLDYDGLTSNQALSLRASGDVIINNQIFDSNPGTVVNLNLTLGGGSALISGSTSAGAVDVNAPINLTSGTFIATGKSFDNTNGTITAGMTSIQVTGDLTVGADITASSVSMSSVTTNLNAPVNSAGAVNMTSSGATTIAASVSGTAISISSSTMTISSAVSTSGNLTLTSSDQMNIDAPVSANDITLNANGLTTTAAITASGAFSMSNSGASSLGAPISAGTLSLSSTMDLEGDLSVSGSMGTGGTLNILTGGTLSVATLESDIPEINIDGGTFAYTGGSFGSGEAITFNSGTISLSGNRTLTSSNALNQRLLGTSVSGGKTIEIEGVFTLSTPFSIDGGTLSVGGLANGYNLSLTSGKLEFAGGTFEVTDGAAFGDTLDITSGQMISVVGSASAVIASDGYVSLSGGRLAVDTTLTNGGEIVLASPTTRIQGSGTFTNNGLLQGTGRIDISDTINSPTGQIRVGTGQSMRFLTSLSNNGRIELQGGSFETGSLSNGTGSVVAMSGGATLRLNPSAPSFNAGSVLISGNADVYGDLVNDTGGVVRVGGGGVVNFFDDIDNNAEFEVAGGSAAVFFGTLDPGSIGGFGTIAIFGGLGPRIGQNGVEGDVTLGDAATTTMLIGTATEYSSLTIGGEGQLAGTLVVTETGYRHLGAVYELITADSLVGQFSNVILPAAGFGMNYELQYNGNSVFAVVVPEPATLSALAGLVALGLRRRR